MVGVRREACGPADASRARGATGAFRARDMRHGDREVCGIMRMHSGRRSELTRDVGAGRSGHRA
jgi:hypothetical protein